MRSGVVCDGDGWRGVSCPAVFVASVYIHHLPELLDALGCFLFCTFFVIEE